MVIYQKHQYLFCELFKFLYVDDLRGENMVPPSKKLNDLIRLAELCVDLLQQNEEHYAEVSYGLKLLPIQPCGATLLHM